MNGMIMDWINEWIEWLKWMNDVYWMMNEYMDVYGCGMIKWMWYK